MTHTRKSFFLFSFALLAAVPAVFFLLVFTLDFFWLGNRNGAFHVLDVLSSMSVEDSRQILGGMGEVITAILGIVITVASIIVQLAATRYTPRITEMFFKDRTNLLVIAFFIRARCSAAREFLHPKRRDRLVCPVAGSMVVVAHMTLSLFSSRRLYLLFHFLSLKTSFAASSVSASSLADGRMSNGWEAVQSQCSLCGATR
jgi:hypothetical protein